MCVSFYFNCLFNPFSWEKLDVRWFGFLGFFVVVVFFSSIFERWFANESVWYFVSHILMWIFHCDIQIIGAHISYRKEPWMINGCFIVQLLVILPRTFPTYSIVHFCETGATHSCWTDLQHLVKPQGLLDRTWSCFKWKHILAEVNLAYFMSVWCS